MTTADELNERMQALWQKFRPLMLKRLKVISNAIATLDDEGRLPNTLKIQAAHEAHKLAGSLGTFGLQEGSAAALEIERLFANSALGEASSGELSRQFGYLKQAIEDK